MQNGKMREHSSELQLGEATVRRRSGGWAPCCRLQKVPCEDQKTEEILFFQGVPRSMEQTDLFFLNYVCKVLWVLR